MFHVLTWIHDAETYLSRVTTANISCPCNARQLPYRMHEWSQTIYHRTMTFSKTERLPATSYRVGNSNCHEKLKITANNNDLLSKKLQWRTGASSVIDLQVQPLNYFIYY